MNLCGTGEDGRRALQGQAEAAAPVLRNLAIFLTNRRGGRAYTQCVFPVQFVQKKKEECRPGPEAIGDPGGWRECGGTDPPAHGQLQVLRFAAWPWGSALALGLLPGLFR